MREPKRHLLKFEISENGTIYKEKRVDIFTVILLGLITVFVVMLLAFLTIQYILPLFMSGAFSHG